ncbi:MAG TPA: resolvase, partial [Pseudogracilibacillus sp.]|nr:resolvase [Pseudogracilibacillus sp.]
ILTDISSNSAHSISQLNKELVEIEKRLKEIEQLQAKYMDAFEKNTLPIDILQERLQKVSDDKRGFEQRKNEVIMQLGSIDSKVIQPDLIEKLLKKFLSVYKKTTRENQKQLLLLLIDNITIKQDDKSRSIKKYRT